MAEDRRKLAMLTPVFLLCGISEMLNYNGYVTLFNERFGSEYLPYVYTAEAFILPLEAWFMSWLTGRLKKPRLMRGLFAAMGCVIVLNAAVLLLIRVSGLTHGAFYPFLFLSSSFVVRQQTVLLWSLAVDLCPTQQAKRLMPLFVSAAALGGIIAGLLAKNVSLLLGADVVYMLAPLFLLAGSVNYWRSISRYLVPLTLKESQTSEIAGTGVNWSSSDYFKRAFTWPYMLTTIGIMTLMPALYLLMEYEFFVTSRTIYKTEAEFGAYFGMVTTLLFTLAFTLQLVSRRISTWLGPSNMVAAISVIFAVCFITLSFALGTPAVLFAVSLSYMFLYVFLYYYAEPANQMFFKLLPISRRDGYRYVVQGVSVSAGMLLGAALQWLHAGAGLGLPAITWIGVAVTVLLVLLARIGRRLYLKELIHTVQMMTEPGEVVSASFDEFLQHGRFTAVLSGLLDHKNDYAREVALEIIGRTQNAGFLPKLLLLTTDPGARIRIAALKAIDLSGTDTDQVTLDRIALLLDDPDIEVRVECTRLLGRAQSSRLSRQAADHVRRMLSDAHPQIVAEAVKALYSLHDERSYETCCKIIQRFLQQGGEPVVAICRMIAELEMGQYAHEMQQLLSDPSPAVREAAIGGLGALRHTPAIPRLLEQLEWAEPTLRETTVRTFIRMGSETVGPLLAALPDTQPKVWSSTICALVGLLDEAECRNRLVPDVIRAANELWSSRDTAGALKATGADGLVVLADLRLHELRRFLLEGAWAVIERLMDPAVAQAIRQASEDDDEETRDSGIEALTEGLGDKRLTAALLPHMSGPEEANRPELDGAAAEAILKHTARHRDPWMRRLATAVIDGKEERMANHERQLLGLLDKVVFLKQVPFFTELSLEELGRVAGIAVEQFHPGGTRLFTQGTVNKTMGVIVKGYVQIATIDSSGEERVVSELHRKYVYGESSSLYGTLTTANGTAAGGELHILAINGDELAKLIRLYPGIGIGVLRAAFDRVRRLEQLVASDAVACLTRNSQRTLASYVT